MDKTKVIFIDLTISNKQKYVCDIVEKLFNDDKNTAVYVKDRKDADMLDRLLWVWKQDTFIPHIIAEEMIEELEDPVVIIKNKEILPKTEALVLFDPLPIDYFDLYKIVIDFAEVYSPQKTKESRTRYKQARDADNYDLKFIKLGEFLKQ